MMGMPMMKKMMPGMMDPEGMSQMIGEMMKQMVSDMNTSERSAFMKDMMKSCIKEVFANLPVDDAKKLAKEMLTAFAEELKTV